MSTVRITKRCREKNLPELPRNIRETCLEKLRALGTDPNYGKPLTGELRPYRSVPVGRYRIIYRCVPAEDTAFVVRIGIRREGSRDDVYALLLKDIRSGKITLE